VADIDLTSGNLCTFICPPIQEDNIFSNRDITSPRSSKAGHEKPNTSFKQFQHPLFKQIPFKRTKELEPETVEMLSPKE
jgi:hypothetical protein